MSQCHLKQSSRDYTRTTLIWIIIIYLLIEDLFARVFHFVGQSFSGHAISTHQATSLLDCHTLCIYHPRCLSYNYQYMSTSLTHMCEINDTTGKMCAHDMIRATGFKHYEDTVTA